jgi:hypothetical protein
MAQPSETFDSYDGVNSNREDLTDIIYNISPTDTPFMSSIGRVKVSSTTHEWQTDSLASFTANNKVIDGDEATNDAITATTRVTNLTQISDKVIVVSGTQEVVNKAGKKSEVAYQVAKAGKELKRDMECRLTSPQIAETGSSSGARECSGAEAVIKTNTSHGVSGSTNGTADCVDGTQRAFTEVLLKPQIKGCYTEGGMPGMIMVGPHNKSVASGFGGIATIYRDQKNVGQGVIIGAADIYVSDFGTFKIIPNRVQRDRTALILDTDYWAVGYLRPFSVKPLARTGDSEKRQMLCEYTLEYRNEASSGKVAELTTS